MSVPQQRPTFVMMAFALAAIPSVALLLHAVLVRRHRMSATELGFGTIMGMANVLQTHLILKCLESLPGFIVFPATSAVGVLITTVVAVQLLGEKLGLRTYVGIAIAVIALVLLNWSESGT